MAAGLGFKDFVTGEVLTAADVDGYLMQGIWVFASAAARDSAVTSPQEGNACYLKDTNQVLTYSGSAWVAVGGGASPLTTKGDVYGFSTTDARIPIGANDTVLTADSTQALGLKWAAVSAGGMTLLASGSLAASATGFDLTSISGAYNELWLYISDLSANATGGTGFNTSLYLNNDTAGSNYSFAGTSGGSVLNTNNSTTGFSLLSTETAGADFSAVVRIPNYTDATSTQIITSVGHLFPTNTVKEISGIWSATPAAIDRLTLKIGSGAYDGGTYKLYGVK
jgi:hypothetical protein